MLSIRAKAAYCSSLFLLATGAAWADQVVMKNGDRVTGSIVKKDCKDLVIKTDQFGVVTMPWDQVESVKADQPLNVVLPDGRIVHGTITTTNGKVEVITQDTKVSFAPAEVATIRNTDEQLAYERLLRFNTAKQKENNMREEMMKRVAGTTGLSPDQAKAAVDAVLGFLKEKMPSPLASSLESFMGGGSSDTGSGSGSTSMAGSVLANLPGLKS